MIQEDKELLIKDLCARLPYGVKINKNGTNFDGTLIDSELRNNLVVVTTCENSVCNIPIDEIKPYLRPLSSMTEEEYDDMFHQLYLAQEEFFRNCSNADTIGKIIGNDMVRYDWLTKKMFDFRCLIPKGLAIEAPEWMYN